MPRRNQRGTAQSGAVVERPLASFLADSSPEDCGAAAGVGASAAGAGAWEGAATSRATLLGAFSSRVGVVVVVGVVAAGVVAAGAGVGAGCGVGAVRPPS